MLGGVSPAHTHIRRRKGGNFLFKSDKRSFKRVFRDEASLEILQNVSQDGTLLSLQER